MKIAIVLLAGGKGSRIGGGKPTRMLGGVTLLERAVDQARKWSERVAVTARHDQQIQGLEVPLVPDEPRVEGPLGGLVSALRFAEEEAAEAVLTLPIDMPFLPDDLVDRLAKFLPGRCAAIASSANHLHPVCGIWRTKATGFLPDYLATGRRSLRGFAETVGYVAVEWPTKPMDPFFNINTPDDLAAAERMLRD